MKPELRTSYDYDERPFGATLNAIHDDPNWGNELYFLHLTDLETGEEFRQGIVPLTPGRQYKVEVVVHNASKFSEQSANNVELAVGMTYDLAGGALGILSATLSADNTTPTVITSSLELYSEESVRLEYLLDSATYQSAIGGASIALNYESLFKHGSYIGTVFGKEDGGVVAFVIRAIADETIPLATGEEKVVDPILAAPYVSEPEAAYNPDQNDIGVADNTATDSSAEGDDTKSTEILLCIVFIGMIIAVVGGAASYFRTKGKTPEESSEVVLDDQGELHSSIANEPGPETRPASELGASASDE